MNWEEVAIVVSALSAYRREHPEAMMSELEREAVAIEQQVPGWSVTYWQDRHVYALVPNLTSSHQAKSTLSPNHIKQYWTGVPEERA
ncbi:MAG: hypothetical protein J2P37_20050 [Ktedonobacteraceae bacterium]|nr:hypothetical protein [Ktedonobacteraceae bacterium]